MRHSAAVLTKDEKSLQILDRTLDELGIGLQHCRIAQEALESVLTGRSATLIVDFDLSDAGEVVRMASLLPPGQKPLLLAIESVVWPGTGQAFQSGAARILHKPIDVEVMKEALKRKRKDVGANRRKSERHAIRTLVYLDLASGTLPGVSIDIGEHGLALQAIERVPMSSDVPFRCVLPGTHLSVHGYADVIWAGDEGRAGLFFSKLAPEARNHLKHWISRHGSRKNAVRGLLPPADAHVAFAPCDEELVGAL